MAGGEENLGSHGRAVGSGKSMLPGFSETGAVLCTAPKLDKL